MENRDNETLAWGLAPACAFLALLTVDQVTGKALQQFVPAVARDHVVRAALAFVLAMACAQCALLLVQRAIDRQPVNEWLRRAKIGIEACAVLVAGGLGILADRAMGNPAMSEVLAQVVLVLLLSSVMGIPLLTLHIASLYFHESDNRAAILRKLERRYTAFLGSPLLNGARTDLCVRMTTGAPIPTDRARPAEASEPITLAPEQTLRSLVDVRADQVVVIAGEGIGKSTQLYVVGLELTHEALADPSARLPVVLDLSTWTATRPARRGHPFEEWLARAISETYHVDRRISTRWVAARRVLPLLDALDIINDEPRRAACVQAITHYAAQRSGPPIVVCCRPSADGGTPALSLTFRRTIHLESPPLVPAQGQALLDRGKRVGMPRSAADANSALGQELRTPLMLNVAVSAYQGQPMVPDDILDDILHAQDRSRVRRALFHEYIARRLSQLPAPRLASKRRADEPTAAAVEQAVMWVAYQLHKHHVLTFYSGDVQGDWLPEGKGRTGYKGLVVGMQYAVRVIAGTLLGLLAALIVTWVFAIDDGKAVVTLYGPGSTTIAGIHIDVGLILRVIIGVIGGIGVGLRFARTINPRRPIVLADRGTFVSHARRRLQRIAIAAACIGVLVVAIDMGLGVQLLVGIAAGLVTGLIVGIAAGLTSVGVDESDELDPRQGLYRAVGTAAGHVAFYMVLGMVIGGLVGGLPLWAAVHVVLQAEGPATSLGMAGALAGGLTGAICAGLFVGVDVGLRNGGAAALQHLALRWTLERSKVVPPHLEQCLAAAVDVGLLCRAGSGYTFVATMLRDYLASTYTARSATIDTSVVS